MSKGDNFLVGVLKCEWEQWGRRVGLMLSPILVRLYIVLERCPVKWSNMVFYTSQPASTYIEPISFGMEDETGHPEKNN